MLMESRLLGNMPLLLKAVELPCMMFLTLHNQFRRVWPIPAHKPLVLRCQGILFTSRTAQTDSGFLGYYRNSRLLLISLKALPSHGRQRLHITAWSKTRTLAPQIG